MNFSQLEAFVQVVKQKSFSKAAKVLYLSQPTISLKIKELERSIGAELVARSTKAVSVTPLGESLYPYAKKILDLRERMFAEGARLRTGVHGKVTIAVSSTPAQYLLPPVLVKVATEYPDVAFGVLRSDSAQVTDDVLSGVAEIGVGGREVKHASLECIKLVADRLTVIAPPCEPYTRLAAPLSADAFCTLPFVGREEGSGTKSWTLAYLASLGVSEGELNEIAVLPGNEHVVAAVKAGLGISVVSALAVAGEIGRGEVISFPITDTAQERFFYLIKNRKRPLSALAAVVAEALTAFAAALDA